MKYLLVGKNGVFETMIVAMGFLGLNDMNSCKEFANVQMENTGKTIKIGTDAKGNDVYVVGNKFPDIVEIVNNELKALSNKPVNSELTLIKIATQGDNLNSYLIVLAKIPLLGTLFAHLAKYLTLQSKAKLIQQGQNLRLVHQAGLDPKVNRVIAAKPY